VTCHCYRCWPRQRDQPHGLLAPFARLRISLSDIPLESRQPGYVSTGFAHCRMVLRTHTQAFRVLARKTASARSPRNGTNPRPKSRITLKSMRDLMAGGSPPSICPQVLTTFQAKNISMKSPILESEEVSARSGHTPRHGVIRETYTGMMPTTLLQPNLMPNKLKRDMSRRYARLRTFFSTVPSCSDSP